MAEMTIMGAVQNTRNSATDSGGYALPPLAANLKEGQIAVNTSDTDPCIFFKSVTGAIIKIPSEGVLVKALTDILGNSAADLDTLRELIALFEGSSKDILPMLTALTDRITAVEGTLTGHINNRSNPHGVTKSQVGLGNVDNTADSAKPVSTAQATAIADAKKAGTDAQSNLTSHVNDKANPHSVTAAQVGALPSGGTAVNSDKLGGIVAANYYHKGNANLPTVDWRCKVLNANNYGEFGTSVEYYSRITNNAHWFINKSDGSIKGGLSINSTTNNPIWNIGGAGYNMYHSGNSNKSDVDWAANKLFVNGNAGFGTNNPTDRIHAVGNVRATEKGIFGGNVESNGSGIFAGDVVAKKSGAVTFSTSDAAAGATRLNDLVDVKIPTDISAKMVLNYDPTQVNSDGTTGGFTFSPAVGVGTGKVDAAVINSLPDHNHNDITYVSASDERLKENIVPLTGALNILLHFKPKQYTWNAEGNKLGMNDPRAYGLIAQEAAELKDIVDIVRPMNVHEGYLGVDYVKIVPILIGGVQEQHKEIISLNRKLDAMQSRANKAYGSETNNADEITKLKAEIEELKMLIKNK